MRRNEALLHLALILNKCNELNLPCEPAINHYGGCINDIVDEVMPVIKRLCDKPYNRNSRMTLVIDFEKMTDVDYWTNSKIFKILPKDKSQILIDKLEEMADMLKMLHLKMKNIDMEYAVELLKRMKARCDKKRRIFDYEIWKAAHPDYTLDMLLSKEVDLTAEVLMKGVLAYDETPKDEEVEAVRVEMVQKHRKYDEKLPRGFEEECAKLKRYSYWEGKYLFIIDYPRLYRYLFMNCFEKLDKKQRWALYEYNMQLQMIHQDIRELLAEQEKAENYSELMSEKAMVYWKRLMELGLVDGNCKLLPETSRQQAMYIVEPFAEKLGLKKQWKPFEDLWCIKNLAQEKYKFQQTAVLPPRHQEIDKVFEDERK